MIYFDNAATTGHKPQTVVNAVNYALKNLSVNPGRSSYTLSQNAAQMVYNSRKKVSNFFGSSGPETVIFTLNCTQSINFVLKGVLSREDHIIVSDLEHNAVMRPVTEMGIDFSQAEVSLIDNDKTLKNFERLIKPNTKMIFCTAASNVLGKILPLKEIGELCKKRGILFGVDAAQAAGVLPINMNEMNIDYLCIAAHKGLYCPMGLGILIARSTIKKTIIEGGTGTESLLMTQPKTQPEMFESGTINLPAIVALIEGINFVKSRNFNIMEYENALVKKFYLSSKDSNVIFYTNPLISDYVPVISFNVVGHSSDYVCDYLNQKGFALRSGLHCAPNAHKKIGTVKQGTVRFSPSVFNTYNEVEWFIKILKKI